MIGILLAGGKSTRFAKGDKALYFDDDLQTTWTEASYKKLSAVCDQVIISANTTNRTEIQELLPEANLILDSSEFTDQGPLSALYAVSQSLANDKKESYVILAVDHPELESKTLQELIDTGSCYLNDQYTIAQINFSFSQIRDFLLSGERRFKKFLELVDAQSLEITTINIQNHNEI
ncbi:MAG: NTP transferase domain-containing protein [Streptococcaceae bacterium]|nr:NTP transferase domain-containing protein [Streptococcaceae bacterium]